jgi:hypothetical protein
MKPTLFKPKPSPSKNNNAAKPLKVTPKNYKNEIKYSADKNQMGG